MPRANKVAKRKQRVYFPPEMVEEVAREAQRLDRSTAWLMHHAWQIARAEVRALPSAPKPLPEETPC